MHEAHEFVNVFNVLKERKRSVHTPSEKLIILLSFFYLRFNFSFISLVFRSDPVRPFISGHVANSMAAEVIALLHSLLTAPESNTAQIWTTTAEKVSEYIT